MKKFNLIMDIVGVVMCVGCAILNSGNIHALLGWSVAAIWAGNCLMRDLRDL